MTVIPVPERHWGCFTLTVTSLASAIYFSTFVSPVLQFFWNVLHLLFSSSTYKFTKHSCLENVFLPMALFPPALQKSHLAELSWLQNLGWACKSGYMHALHHWQFSLDIICFRNEIHKLLQDYLHNHFQQGKYLCWYISLKQNSN